MSNSIISPSNNPADDGDAENGANGFGGSLNHSQLKDTIIQGGKIAWQPVLVQGGIEHSHLVLSITSKDRLGVIQKLTEIVREEGGNIVFCEGDLMMPSMQKIDSEDRSSHPMAATIRDLRSLRLGHFVFLVIGSLESMQNIWHRSSSIVNLTGHYIERQGEYETFLLRGEGQDGIGILETICTTLYGLKVNVRYLLSEATLSLEPTSNAKVQMTLELPVNRKWGKKHLVESLVQEMKINLAKEWCFSLRNLDKPASSLYEAMLG